jgi:hypothetical protein
MEPDDAPRIVPRTEPFRNCYFELHGRRTTHGLFSNLNCISHFKSLEDRTDPHQEGSRRFARSIFLPLFRLTDGLSLARSRSSRTPLSVSRPLCFEKCPRCLRENGLGRLPCPP